MAQTLLQVEDLHTQFKTSRGVVRAVDGVNFHIDVGETLGVVGESGCGKTMTALSILRLLPDPGKIVSGRILFRGKDVTKMDQEEIRDFRGKLAIRFPLLVAGFDGMDLARQLGDPEPVLPYTALVSPSGRVVERQSGRLQDSELRGWLVEHAHD